MVSPGAPAGTTIERPASGLDGSVTAIVPPAGPTVVWVSGALANGPVVKAGAACTAAVKCRLILDFFALKTPVRLSQLPAFTLAINVALPATPLHDVHRAVTMVTAFLGLILAVTSSQPLARDTFDPATTTASLPMKFAMTGSPWMTKRPPGHGTGFFGFGLRAAASAAPTKLPSVNATTMRRTNPAMNRCAPI